MNDTLASTGFSRRAFIAGCMAAGAVGCSTARTARKGELDPCAIGVVSDIHTGLPWGKQQYRTGMEYPWMPEAAKRLVADILALPNPPANIIGLGDISLAFGEDGDYKVAAEVLKPLTDAGIKVTHAMGNHDIRAEFLKYFPGYDKTTKVPGKFVSVVETPHADFILLDSLVEPTKRGSYPACTGLGLGDAQVEWLKTTLAATTKPTFVCAHHKADDLKIGTLCAKSPAVVGYLHGHHHHWMTNFLFKGYSATKARVVRMMGFPTLGLNMDVGFGVLRTTPSGATLHCYNRDFYFPVVKKGKDRPASWDGHVRDWADREIDFSFSC